MAKGVPSLTRAKDLLKEDDIVEEEGDDGWVIAEQKGGKTIADIDGEEEKKEEPEEDDDVADIDDSSDEDENIFASEKPQEDVESGVQACRRYDISMTYDVYYQTPRLWLTGYDENK